MSKFVIGLLAIIVYAFGWIGSVGIIALFQWLVNETFGKSFDINVWIGGLLFYLIWLLFKR